MIISSTLLLDQFEKDFRDFLILFFTLFFYKFFRQILTFQIGD